MPVCVHCSTDTDSLYVSYGPTHLLCTRCLNCGQYADPYVEHEAAIVAIDLLLVKPRAYRHVLFNRPHLDLSEKKGIQSQWDKKPEVGKKAKVGGVEKYDVLWIWWKLFKRFLALLLVDSYIRWFYVYADYNNSTGDSDERLSSFTAAWRVLQNDQASNGLGASQSYLFVLAATAMQSLALYATALALSLVYYHILNHLCHRYNLGRQVEKDLSRFKSHQVPTSLLLANVAPTFLLSLLLLWKSPPNDGKLNETNTKDTLSVSLFFPFSSSGFMDDKDLQWSIRSLVGGLSSGVALGVVLPRQRTKTGAFATSFILLAAWLLQAKTCHLVGLNQ